MVKQRKSAEEIERMITGGEPSFGAAPVSEIGMMRALNWYSNNKDLKDAIRYINEYLKKNKIKVPAEIVNKQFSTYGYLCRMKTNGAVFSENYQIKFDNFINTMKNTKESAPVVIVEDKKPVVSIQERIQERTKDIIGEIEGSIDDLVLSNFKTVPSPQGILQNMNAKGVHISKVLEWFKKRRSVFDDVLTTSDKQIVEGYSCFNKTQIKKLISYCDQIITDCGKIVGEVKATRKPRKRKVKTPDQLVSKVQVLESSDEYKLKGEPTKNIIGAISLWVFNVKYKRLGVYYAADSQGFGVKGTSLTNFSETKSIQKTLRKPNEVLPNIVKGGKVYLRNIMNELTTKESALNGRLNGETIIVKVIK